MVHVPVEDGYSFDLIGPVGVVGGQGYIGEETEAHRQGRQSVVAGGTPQDKGGP